MSSQDPKYDFKDGQLISRDSGPVPHDEPVFILRAKDSRAVAALAYYQSICRDADHQVAVGKRIEDFERFEAEHPDRMKEPDTIIRDTTAA